MEIQTIDNILFGLSVLLMTVSISGAVLGAYVMCRREFGGGK